MRWVGGIFGLALVSVVVAVGTDVYMTSARLGRSTPSSDFARHRQWVGNRGRGEPRLQIADDMTVFGALRDGGL
jgi:hypothetical protein